MSELTRRYVVMAMAAAAPFDPTDHDAPFVLKPWKDPAALIALKSYRDHCYPELARDLDEWIRLVEAGPLVLGGVGRRNEAHLASREARVRSAGEAERPGRKEDRRPIALEGQGQRRPLGRARRSVKPQDAPPSDRSIRLLALLRARSHRERCAPPSEEQPLTMAEAYAIQDRLRDVLVSQGEQVIGWKAGFTGKAAQDSSSSALSPSVPFSSGPACMRIGLRSPWRASSSS